VRSGVCFSAAGLRAQIFRPRTRSLLRRLVQSEPAAAADRDLDPDPEFRALFILPVYKPIFKWSG
jgi:hypothetical protein